MQLNLARNILRKMPTGVPNGIIQLFLDRNSIGDIPKQVYSAYISITWKKKWWQWHLTIPLLFYVKYGSHLFKTFYITANINKMGYCAVLRAGCCKIACNATCNIKQMYINFNSFSSDPLFSCSGTISKTSLNWHLWGWTATSWVIRGFPRLCSTFPPCWTCNCPTTSLLLFLCSTLTWSTCTSTTTASRVSQQCSNQYHLEDFWEKAQ